MKKRGSQNLVTLSLESTKCIIEALVGHSAISPTAETRGEDRMGGLLTVRLELGDRGVLGQDRHELV